MSHSGIVSKEL